MARKRKISFLAKKKVKGRVSFKTKWGRVSFTAKIPSRKRQRVAFYAKKKKK